ncbi:MAG: hypothetical protein ACKVOH_00855 [Chlamydiales bacterium]
MPQKEEIVALLDELVALQEKTLLKMGRQFVPTLTEEDVLQPMDYPQLEYNAPFRYEEGLLAGMHSVRSAVLALFHEDKNRCERSSLS